MMTRIAKLLALAALAAGLTACPETLQQTCPQGSSSAGSFSLVFSEAPPPADTSACRVILTPDGGPADAAITNTPAQTQAILCSSGDDGGSVLLSVPGQVVRKSPLGEGGAFRFDSGALDVSGTQCGCRIDIFEGFAGKLLGKDGGAVALEAGGKLSPVGSIEATLVDEVAMTDAGSNDGGCRCNLPCTLSYTIKGTPL